MDAARPRRSAPAPRRRKLRGVWGAVSVPL